MRAIILSLPLLFVLGCSRQIPVETLPATQPIALEFDIELENAASGRLAYAIYDSEERFDAREDPLRSGFVTPTGEETRIELDPLPPGRYAAAFYLDRNANGRLDRNALGIPTEPYGFSNDARGRFGPPNFATARFELSPGIPPLRVRLR